MLYLIITISINLPLTETRFKIQRPKMQIAEVRVVRRQQRRAVALL